MLKPRVTKFYVVPRDAHDRAAESEVLRENFTFRGSPGQHERGHAGFADRVHTALGEYHCHIEALVEEGDRVFAMMKFYRYSVGEFPGYAPSGRRISPQGYARFTFDGDLVADVRVLGDLKAIETQLENNRG